MKLMVYVVYVVDKAMRDLDWAPKYNMLDGLKDSYNNDFKIKKVPLIVNSTVCTHAYIHTFSICPIPSQAAGYKADFFCDDLVLKDDRVAVMAYNGMPADDLK